MLETLWGLKTIAFFDVWSIEHLLSGISVGEAVKNRHDRKALRFPPDPHHKVRSHLDLIGVLFLAYLWETLEHYLEIGLAGEAIEYWFQGVEFFGNRFVTDPLLMVVGYKIAKNYPSTVWPARLASLLWLLIHIFVFPHSMYLHEIF